MLASPLDLQPKGNAAERPPTVSVGVPVYNGEVFLRASLESLLAQTFTDFEVIVSDNGSTDATASICAEFAGRDPRIRSVRSDTNRGAAWNYNRTFELARGRYFRWCAADDLAAPDSLEKCVAFLSRHPEFVLAYPRTQIIDDRGTVITDYEDGLDVRQPTPHERAKHVLRRTRECNAVFGLIDAERLRSTALIGSYVGSDHILLLELAFQGPFAELRDTIFYRRVHPHASSSDKSVARQREFYDPTQDNREFEQSCVMRTWRHTRESLRALRRAPIPIVQKLHCLWFVVRRTFASRAHLLAEFRRSRSLRRIRT